MSGSAPIRWRRSRRNSRLSAESGWQISEIDEWNHQGLSQKALLGQPLHHIEDIWGAITPPVGSIATSIPSRCPPRRLKGSPAQLSSGEWYLTISRIHPLRLCGLQLCFFAKKLLTWSQLQVIHYP